MNVQLQIKYYISVNKNDIIFYLGSKLSIRKFRGGKNITQEVDNSMSFNVGDSSHTIAPGIAHGSAMERGMVRMVIISFVLIEAL